MEYPRGPAIIFSFAPCAKGCGLYGRKKRLYMHQADLTGRSGSAAMIRGSRHRTSPCSPLSQVFLGHELGRLRQKRKHPRKNDPPRDARASSCTRPLRTCFTIPARHPRACLARTLRGTLRDFALYVFIPSSLALNVPRYSRHCPAFS
jgi:hypothetical protein